MAPLRLHRSAGLLLAAALAVASAGAEPERSATIKQLAPGATLAERSNAAFEQITPATIDARGRVDQIDPTLAAATDDTDLAATGASSMRRACVLTPDQLAIVTSLEAQGRLPAGDCEMAAFLAHPSDKSDEDRRAAAAAVLAAAPELVGRESEAAVQAREAEERRQSAAAAETAAAVSTFLLPKPSGQ